MYEEVKLFNISLTKQRLGLNPKRLIIKVSPPKVGISDIDDVIKLHLNISLKNVCG